MVAGPGSDSTRIPPVECVAWCVDGAGHTDEIFRGDQWCAGEANYVTLSLEEVKREGEHFFTTDIGVMPRRGWRQFPSVYLHINGEGRKREVDESFELTPDEARSLAAMLTETADLIEGEG